MKIDDLKRLIRDIPDFPRRGILFRDITPALGDPEAFATICDAFVERYRELGIDSVAGIEARGFLFASVAAYLLGLPLIPLRKPGKLPWKTVSRAYDLEYGTAAVEMHLDAVKRGDRVLIIDDLLATGGTAAAAAALVEGQGGTVVELAFAIELSELGGRNNLGSRPVFSLITL
ncbi:MAG: adenine phosphoribosyltransferase [Candidatus Krumholzibacteria bacterium]|nr:adenine phosphoribosyltransferase [Candidatus Krumholzibacteria bacterium]